MPQLQPGYMGSYLLGLFEIKLKKINFTITKTSKLENTPESFVQTTVTRDYWKKEGNAYKIIETYKDSRLRGSSITINDLVYEASVDKHRLFIRNNPATYDQYLRGKIYYRYLQTIKDGSGDSNKTQDASWEYNKTKYLNNLFIYTGPCYTVDNL